MQLLGNYLPWVQVGLSVLLIIMILLQHSDAGLGGAFGGNAQSTFHTKRGFEKTLFFATVIVGALFLGSALFALTV